MMKRLVSAALCFAVALSTVSTAFAADKLQVVTYFGGQDGHKAAYEGLLKEFKSFDVENKSDQSSEAWKQSVISDFNTGNEPDVLVFFTDAQADPILNKVVPISTIRAAYPKYASNILPTALASAASTKGVQYAVPFSGFWEGLFVNKDMFDKHRLEAPTSWDNFTKAIRTFSNANNNVIPIAVGFSQEPHYLIEHMLLSAAGPTEQKVNPGTDVSKVPASWIKGLDMITTLGEMGAFGNMKAAAGRSENLARNEFYQLRAAMMVHGSWLNGGISKSDKLKYGNSVQVYPIPAMPDGKGSGNDVIAGFSSGFYITKKAWDDPARRKEAVDFISYMTSNASLRKLVQSGSAPAANIPTSPNLKLSQSSGIKITNNAASVNMPVDSWLKSAAWTEIWTSAADLASGKTTASQVLNKAIPLNK